MQFGINSYLQNRPLAPYLNMSTSWKVSTYKSVNKSRCIYVKCHSSIFRTFKDVYRCIFEMFTLNHFGGKSKFFYHFCGFCQVRPNLVLVGSNLLFMSPKTVNAFHNIFIRNTISDRLILENFCQDRYRFKCSFHVYFPLIGYKMNDSS